MIRFFKICCLIIVTWVLVLPASAVLKFSNSYRSRRNHERSIRKSTSLIILHTTETTKIGALRKLRDNGECHYYVARNGVVYRVIDHRRVAYHAGRSMWNRRTNLDNFSVGIECSGFHNKSLTSAQYRAIGELVGELQYIYKIPDYRVITHSMVAYGRPNKWHKRCHRGRKRCAMLLARPETRKLMNLTSRPLHDPDVKAGRLTIGDKYLAKVLYGSTREEKKAVAHFTALDSNVISRGRSAWDIARDMYKASTTAYVFPNGSRKQGNQIVNFKLLPVGTKVLVGAQADNPAESIRIIGQQGKAQDIAGAEVRLSSTIYIFPNGKYKRGHQLTAKDILKLPYATKVLVGYDVGGPISASICASKICGNNWKSKDTYFLIAGALTPGNKVDDKKIPSGTMIFYHK
jgi:N-acetylmuramoyl-L-alanine amidase